MLSPAKNDLGTKREVQGHESLQQDECKLPIEGNRLELNSVQKEEEAATFDSIPQLAHLGQPFQSTKPERLTEEETEYSVTLVKHVFEPNILLQFTCTNTVAEQVLEKVSVSLELEDAVRAQLLPVCSFLEAKL